MFKDSFDTVFESVGSGSGPIVEDDMRSLMFGNYMNPDADEEDRFYEEVTALEQFNSVVEQQLEEYNQVNKAKMNLVIFRYANF